MTIDEAIKVLHARTRDEYYKRDCEGVDDIRLGIEALKRIKERRREIGSWDDRLLPGETEE